MSDESAFQVDIARSALLLMDFQHAIAAPGGALAPIELDVIGRFAQASAQAKRALDAARSGGLEVIHVRVALRPGLDPAQVRGPLMSYMYEVGALLEGSEDVAFLPELAPVGEEAVVTKRGISAFAGTDLEALLRYRGIDTIVLSGVVTHWVVEGTARDAYERGIGIVTLEDACTSATPERHLAALLNLQSLGEVITTAELLAALGVQPGGSSDTSGAEDQLA